MIYVITNFFLQVWKGVTTFSSLLIHHNVFIAKHAVILYTPLCTVSVRVRIPIQARDPRLSTKTKVPCCFIWLSDSICHEKHCCNQRRFFDSLLSCPISDNFLLRSYLVWDPLIGLVNEDYRDLLSCNAFDVLNCGLCHSNLHFDNLWLFEVLCATKFMHYCFTEGGFLSAGFIVICCWDFTMLSRVLSYVQITMSDKIT